MTDPGLSRDNPIHATTLNSVLKATGSYDAGEGYRWAALDAGTACHRVFEAWYHNKHLSWQEAFLEELDKARQQGFEPKYTKDPSDPDLEKKKADFHARFEKIITMFQPHYEATFRPAQFSAEASFIGQVGRYWIAGTMDAMVMTGIGQGTAVVDWKTGKKPLSAREMDSSLQPPLYRYALAHFSTTMEAKIVETDGRRRIQFPNDWTPTLKYETFRGLYPEFWFVHPPSYLSDRPKSVANRVYKVTGDATSDAKRIVEACDLYHRILAEEPEERDYDREVGSLISP